MSSNAKPSAIARSPADCGDGSASSVTSAPCTTLATSAIAGSSILYASTSVSNEHIPSRWVYVAPGASKLLAPSRAAYASTSSRGTYTISASGSMNVRISQGQAIRSVLGCSRVTHLMASVLHQAGSSEGGFD